MDLAESRVVWTALSIPAVKLALERTLALPCGLARDFSAFTYLLHFKCLHLRKIPSPSLEATRKLCFSSHK